MHTLHNIYIYIYILYDYRYLHILVNHLSPRTAYEVGVSNNACWAVSEVVIQLVAFNDQAMIMPVIEPCISQLLDFISLPPRLANRTLYENVTLTIACLGVYVCAYVYYLTMLF